MLKAFNSELGHEKLWKDRKPSDVMPTIPHLKEPEKHSKFWSGGDSTRNSAKLQATIFGSILAYISRRTPAFRINRSLRRFT